MSEPVTTKSKEIESKNPVILREKVHRKGDYWSCYSKPEFNLGGNDHTSIYIERTSREEVEKTKESYKHLVRSMTDFNRRIKPKEGEILVKIERLITPPSFIPRWYNAEVGISGDKYQSIRVIGEYINFTGRNESRDWLNKKQLLSDIQAFLLQNPKGIEWIREMEEKDGLFRQIKPKD